MLDRSSVEWSVSKAPSQALNRIHSNRRQRGQRFNRTIPEDGSLARN
uniref:Uncharacterized protein n=1 Tax=Ascaris lumbricoides TaxID=6252 RepID=A0A0M3HN82_ASCLU